MLSENQVIISLITFDYIIAKFMKKFLIKAHKQLHVQNYAKCKTSLLKMSLFALEGEVLFMAKSLNSTSFSIQAFHKLPW